MRYFVYPHEGFNPRSCGAESRGPPVGWAEPPLLLCLEALAADSLNCISKVVDKLLDLLRAVGLAEANRELLGHVLNIPTKFAPVQELAAQSDGGCVCWAGADTVCDEAVV